MTPIELADYFDESMLKKGQERDKRIDYLVTYLESKNEPFMAEYRTIMKAREKRINKRKGF